MPTENTPKGGSGASRAFSVDGYGLNQWYKLFTTRQLYAIGSIIKSIRTLPTVLGEYGYSDEWIQAILGYILCGFDRLLDFANCGVQWKVDGPTINHSFVRFALSLSWDYAEGNIIGESAGSYRLCQDRIASAVEQFSRWEFGDSPLTIRRGSAIQPFNQTFDCIVTDPPYYDAIPYSDLMDFFYVWLKRVLYGLSPEFDRVFSEALSPKWDHENNDGELIDDSSRFERNQARSKSMYEDGMSRAFLNAYESLVDDGRLVIVFAHKTPDAWETLVGALIRAGFVVDGSWPIQTEQASRMRAISSAALSSSVWLVCRKRPETARPGWDNRVLEAMRANITLRLRDYWDAGIRGPDFVWAATGPAMEAYSQHPVVKKADEPGAVMGVEEFLGHVRRMVVDFMVGQVLSREGGETTGLDDVTTYYLLHRKDFGMGDAPASACILYALSCGLTDRALSDQYDVLSRGSAPAVEDESAEDEDDADAETESDEGSGEGSGSTVRLMAWTQRVKRKTLGYEAPGGRPAPLVDQAHRLLALWKVGDVVKVDQFLDEKGLRKSGVFAQLLQALIELASGEERALLESISNHLVARGAAPSAANLPLFGKTDE